MLIVVCTFWLPCLAAATELVAHPFAEGHRDEKLGDVLHTMEELSPSKLCREHEGAQLVGICRQAA